MGKALKAVEDSILQNSIYFSYFQEYAGNVLKLGITSLISIDQHLDQHFPQTRRSHDRNLTKAFHLANILFFL